MRYIYIYIYISLIKKHVAVTHPIHRNEIPTKKTASPYIFIKTACLRAGLVRKYQVFILFPVKLCIGGLQQACFMNDILTIRVNIYKRYTSQLRLGHCYISIFLQN